MVSIAKKLGVILFISSVSINSFAKSIYDDIDNGPDYDSTPYYEDEGSLVIKARLGGVFSDTKQKNLPAPTAPNPVGVGHLIKNGYGGDVSTTIYFNNYFATEFSLGFNVLPIKNTTLANVAYNYGNATTPSKAKPLYMIPATVTGQFHLAPYGGIRPYVGVGYNGSYMLTQCNGIKVRNGHGMVGQIGIDFYAKDDTLINIDVRQFFLNPKVEYKPSLVGTQNVTSKIKINPLIVSIGLGFSF